MKKLFILLVAVVLNFTAFAQVPEKISYQAVIRDSGNTLVSNQAVGIQISILQGASAVYVETQTPTTNLNGLVSIEIGVGSVVSGNFSTIDWSVGTYFIKTETDPIGGNNYTITGTSQLLSVPYALHTKTAESLTNKITELASFTIQNPSEISTSSTNYIQLSNSGVFSFNPNIFELQNSGNYGVKIKKDGYLSVSISQSIIFSGNNYVAIQVFQNGSSVGIGLISPSNSFNGINLTVPLKVFENDIITIQFIENNTNINFVSSWPYSVYSFNWSQN